MQFHVSAICLSRATPESHSAQHMRHSHAAEYRPPRRNLHTEWPWRLHRAKLLSYLSIMVNGEMGADIEMWLHNIFGASRALHLPYVHKPHQDHCMRPRVLDVPTQQKTYQFPNDKFELKSKLMVNKIKWRLPVGNPASCLMAGSLLAFTR